MRSFYIFKIKEEYKTLTKNNPYHLFKMFSYIYQLDVEEIDRATDLFYKLVNSFDTKRLDVSIFKNHSNSYFYTKFKNVHQVHNIYTKEDSKLVVHKHFLELTSSTVRPVFLEDLIREENIFLCDFQNKDYFWLEFLPT